MVAVEGEEEIIVERNIVGYQGRRLRALVVDDKLHNRSVLVHLLGPLGFEVAEAENGQEAVEQARATRPDVIIMDMIMPVMTGFEATQEIRQTPELKEALIIATSASVSDTDRQQFLLAGCDAFLPKPVAAGKLFALLETHLELEWIYEEPTTEEIAQAEAEREAMTGPLAPPPPEEMAVLYDLAMRGNMRRIQERATYLEELDERFIPFASRLRQLAKEFEAQAILALIEQHMGEDK